MRAKRSHAKALFTIVGGAVLINPAFAQQQASAGDELEEIVVTGLHGSLKASMEIKRDAVGVVDAINAEDIGKFPDTNLSEALQRITGVSIDRRNGEGALVTARGFGPNFNLVTLNGRQMPAADAFGGGNAVVGGTASGSRSFNFANLSAEAISGVEVYKTGRADIPTGGIGATVNIKTARPFDNDGLVLNLGAKALDDTSNRVGSDITPEVNGIFSYANDTKTWGVGLNASYSKRRSGSMQSTVNDWHIQPYGDLSKGPISPTATIENAPKAGQLYGIPDDVRYAFSDQERERVNAQLVAQFAPTDSLTLTADYTFAQNEITEDRGEQTVWMQRNGFTHVVFDTNETVATPVFLQEMTGSGKDYGYEQQHREQKNDLKSIGLNVDWKVTDSFTLGFDGHDSKARSLPNDPITGGSETLFSAAGKVPSTGNCQTGVCTNFWTQEFTFNNGLPVAGRTLYNTNSDALAGVNGNSDFSFDASSLGSQVMRLNYQAQETEIKQARLDGTLDFSNDGRLQFGVETRKMEMTQRSSGGYMALGDWGVGKVGQEQGMVDLLSPFSLTGAFDDWNPNGAPTGGWKGNADQLGIWATEQYGQWNEQAMTDGEFRYNPGFQTNNNIEETSKAVYFQFGLGGELGDMPVHLLLGARYETTDVDAINVQLPVQYLQWQDDNDFQVPRTGDPSQAVMLKGKGHYNNLLPSLDFDVSITDNLKGRFSYSKTIARANYGNLTVGATPNGPNGSTLLGAQATGNDNNPDLLPLESDNFDLSLEYYFSDTGYVSVGFWDKRVNNFIGTASFNEPIVGLGGANIKDQTGGPRAQAARAALLAGNAHNGNQPYAVNDSSLFTMMAMIENTGTFTDKNGTWTGGAANYDGSDAQHVAFATQYDLYPQADDPDYIFRVAKPINNRQARIHGFEFGGQYFFGETGFGVLANYTIGRGDVGFDNNAPVGTNQFALLGLSDSANAVLMYEKFGFSARLAYNWRDKFLQSANQGAFNNPIWVAPHDQFDLSLGYDVNEHISVSLEAVNVTGEDVRWYGRSEKQMWRLEDDGARYALGARYKF
ncbi:MAG TPA: TonB-dependent receptor [Steroidobacteraceae bacterium]|nr:TonB-dependent receptor [Steroidobacteraceae bacterium]